MKVHAAMEVSGRHARLAVTTATALPPVLKHAAQETSRALGAPIT
jgi:hypothetical protein